MLDPSVRKTPSFLLIAVSLSAKLDETLMASAGMVTACCAADVFFKKKGVCSN